MEPVALQAESHVAQHGPCPTCSRGLFHQPVRAADSSTLLRPSPGVAELRDLASTAVHPSEDRIWIA